MRRRAVSAGGTDENGRACFRAKTFQPPRQRPHSARHKMRKRPQQQVRLAAIDEHQFPQAKVRGQPNFVRDGPLSTA